MSRREGMSYNYRKENDFILALDLGIGSTGWAVVDATKKRIDDLGVLIFESGEEHARKSADRASQKRRSYRSAKRLNRRKKQRKAALIKYLDSISFADMNQLNNSFKEQKNPNDLISLRIKGLDQQLSQLELFSVLIYFCNHRGYKDFYEYLDNKDTDKKEASQMSDAKDAIDTLFASGKYRTLAEMIAKDPVFKKKDNHDQTVIAYRNKKGYQYLYSRADLFHELAMILSKQSDYYECFDTDTNNIIAQLIFHQRYFEEGPGPKNEEQRKSYLFHNKGKQRYTGFGDLIGNCIFYPQEMKWTKNSIVYDEYVLINTLSQMRFYQDGVECGFNKRILHELMLSIFDKKGIITLAEIKKLLKRHKIETNSYDRDTHKYKFPFMSVLTDNLVFDDQTIECFRKEIETKEYRLNDALSNKLGKLLAAYISPELRKKELDTIFDHVTKEMVGIKSAGVANTSFKYMLEAINAFEHGVKYGDFQAKFNENKVFENVQLMYNGKLIAIRDSDLLRNPVVYRTINQCRKLINAIISRYHIVKVNIEIASEVSQSFEQRKKTTEYQKDLAKEKAENETKLKETLLAYNINIPISQKLLDKYTLFLLQKERCMYTNTKIDFMQLLGNEVQVDHIVPQSIVFDDTLNNKVLVIRSANARKGNRLPLECFEEMQEDVVSTNKGYTVKQYKKNCLSLLKSKKISKKKYQYLTLTELTDDIINSFVSRNINDTRYITRYVSNYLKAAFAQSEETKNIKVNAIKGSVTSRLRRKWLTKYTKSGNIPSIYALEDKGRKLHYYHHAVDAVILANINTAYILLANCFDTMQSIRRDRNLSEEIKKAEINKVINNTVKSLRKYHGYSEDFVRRLIDSEYIPSICKNLYDEVQVRIPLDIQLKDENGCYKFSRDLRSYRTLVSLTPIINESLNHGESIDSRISELFNKLSKEIQSPYYIDNNKTYKDGKNCEKIDLTKSEPELINYVKSINQVSNDEYLKRCEHYYNDSDFVSQIELPYIYFKIDRSYRDTMVNSENAVKFKDVARECHVSSIEELSEFLSKLENINSKYYIKPIRDGRNRVNYSIYEANKYYCSEVCKTNQNKLFMRGIKYVDVRKENGQLVLLKPLPDSWEHIMYIFKNEYIMIKKKNGTEIFGAYRGVEDVNRKQIQMRLFSNTQLKKKKCAIVGITENITKYELDILGHLKGEIKCGDLLSFTTEKR